MRPPLHPSEKLLLWIVTLHLCFLPWALGAMHVWSQIVSCAFSALGLAVALRTREYGQELAGRNKPFRLTTWPKLLKFPIFWIGGAFLLYILVQALNPAWRYVQSGQYGWLARLPHADWLPAGMDTPFAMASPWRSLMIYGSAWMTVCSLWIGFTRLRTLRILFVALATNAFALAVLGLAERGLDADKIFWLWQPPASYFVSSFIYKNHAGAYFNLLLSLSAGLAAWYHGESRRRLAKSSPSGLFAFFVAVLALMVVLSYCRAATLLMLAYLASTCLVVLGRRLLAADRTPGGILILVLVGGLLGGSCLLGLYFLPTGETAERMRALVASYRSATPSARRLATSATLEMFRASPAYGWGAGSFRFIFPIYQSHYPAIYSDPTEWLYWEHAHDDYAEFLAEFGIVGTTLLALGGICYLARLARLRFWRDPLSLLLFAGCCVTLLHCLGDFNFYNPAILITWCAFWPALVRWNEIASPASSHST